MSTSMFGRFVTTYREGSVYVLLIVACRCTDVIVIVVAAAAAAIISGSYIFW